MRLVDLLSPDRVRIPLAGRSKDELLRELVEAVVRASARDLDAEALYRAVWDRERVLSTGIGEGVALPHARHPDLEEVTVAAGVSPEPLDFDALDGRPVRLFFLLLGPENAAGTQVRVLSRIARLMRDEDLRERLAAAGCPERFLAILDEAERGF